MWLAHACCQLPLPNWNWDASGLRFCLHCTPGRDSLPPLPPLGLLFMPSRWERLFFPPWCVVKQSFTTKKMKDGTEQITASCRKAAPVVSLQLIRALFNSWDLSCYSSFIFTVSEITAASVLQTLYLSGSVTLQRHVWDPWRRFPRLHLDPRGIEHHWAGCAISSGVKKKAWTTSLVVIFSSP